MTATVPAGIYIYVLLSSMQSLAVLTTSKISSPNLRNVYLQECIIPSTYNYSKRCQRKTQFFRRISINNRLCFGIPCFDCEESGSRLTSFETTCYMLGKQILQYQRAESWLHLLTDDSVWTVWGATWRRRRSADVWGTIKLATGSLREEL